jgi:hypothetical protein
MNKICSDKAPLNRREWSVTKCYKRGVKAGFVAGLRKAEQRQAQAQPPRLIPQQDAVVQFERPDVLQLVRRGRNIAELQETFRTGLIPAQPVQVVFEPPVEQMIEEEQPAVNLKINANVLKKVLSKELYKEFITSLRLYHENKPKPTKPQESYDKFGIKDYQILADFIGLNVPDLTDVNRRMLNDISTDRRVQGNQRLLKTMIDAVVTDIYNRRV